ncbi:MAG TPA: hypothetical protein VFP68_11405 [Burkholderiaceae bacterium]|nr:hypothetical protein [Burkholderiaceae bacterium]
MGNEKPVAEMVSAHLQALVADLCASHMPDLQAEAKKVIDQKIAQPLAKHVSSMPNLSNPADLLRMRKSTRALQTTPGQEPRDVPPILDAARSNDAAAIRSFAQDQLKKIPAHARLQWLRRNGADQAMCETVSRGSPDAITAWADVVQLLPDSRAMCSFLAPPQTPLDARSSPGFLIAAGIYANTHPGAIKAWGELLSAVPDTNQERSRLLMTRDEKGLPAFGQIFERQDTEALKEFATLAAAHVWHGDRQIEQTLLDCQPALKGLTSSRGGVRGRTETDWVTSAGTSRPKPMGLSPRGEGVARAYFKLARLVHANHRNSVLMPQDTWTIPKRGAPGRISAFHGSISESQARQLAHSITLLKAMVPMMTAQERAAVLDNVRTHHARKVMGMWTNTHDYNAFKRGWPALDAMLLDLKAELKQPVRSTDPHVANGLKHK